MYLNILPNRQSGMDSSSCDLVFFFSRSEGHEEVIKVLIDKYKCNHQCTTNRGQTPLHYACRYVCFHPVYKILQQKWLAENLHHYAAEDMHIPVALLRGINNK